MQQFGSLHGGSQTLHYEVVPGSGSGQLDGLTGILHLNIDEDGAHRYELEYELKLRQGYPSEPTTLV